MDSSRSAPAPLGAAMQVLDNPHAPDAFATDAAGFSLIGGNVGVTLVTTKVDHSVTPPVVTGVVIGRLVMPLDGAQRLAAGLTEFLQRRGLDPATTAHP